MKKRLLVLVKSPLALASLCTALPVAAQELPKKTIPVVVGFASGGATDTAARLLRPRWARTLGRPWWSITEAVPVASFASLADSPSRENRLGRLSASSLTKSLSVNASSLPSSCAVHNGASRAATASTRLL